MYLIYSMSMIESYFSTLASIDIYQTTNGEILKINILEFQRFRAMSYKTKYYTRGVGHAVSVEDDDAGHVPPVQAAGEEVYHQDPGRDEQAAPAHSACTGSPASWSLPAGCCDAGASETTPSALVHTVRVSAQRLALRVSAFCPTSCQLHCKWARSPGHEE